MNSFPNLNGLSLADQTVWQALCDYLAEKSPAVVAFSGGVDSGLLAAAMFHVAGGNMLAVNVDSVVHTDADRQIAQAVADKVGFPFLMVPFNDLENQAFCNNPVDRCYVCKYQRFQYLAAYAQEHGFRFVMEGSNVDDASDYRPGMRAVSELGILSPLADCGLTKKQIRAIAKALDLPIWDRPSTPCLATRIPYGTPISLEKIKMVQTAEDYLSELGFQSVRVRYDGRTARIEVRTDQINQLIVQREEILSFMKKAGFIHSTVDLEGYRQGSNNEGLVK